MWGCIDSIKITWKNCAVVEQGKYYNRNNSKKASIIAQWWFNADLYV